MDPGLYSDMDEETYHASPGVSVSKLKLFAEAPAKVLAPRKETRALAFGSLAHCAVLQPHLLESLYCVTDLARISEREKATQAEMERAGKRELVKRADWDDALALRDAVHNHPTLRDMLAPEGMAVEQSFFWRDPVTGLLRRGRADALRNDWGVVLDVKSTVDASPAEFAKSCANYNYHWQQASYEDGLTATWREPEAFLFIAVEKERPFLTGIYELSRADVDRARDTLAVLMRRWAECERTGIWPGYSVAPVTLDLPGWARIEDERASMAA